MSYCSLSLLGYATAICIFAKIVRSILNVIYPYLFAVSHNLLVLAGSRWAGNYFNLKIKNNSYNL